MTIEEKNILDLVQTRVDANVELGVQLAISQNLPQVLPIIKMLGYLRGWTEMVDIIAKFGNSHREICLNLDAPKFTAQQFIEYELYNYCLLYFGDSLKIKSSANSCIEKYQDKNDVLSVINKFKNIKQSAKLKISSLFCEISSLFCEDIIQHLDFFIEKEEWFAVCCCLFGGSKINNIFLDIKKLSERGFLKYFWDNFDIFNSLVEYRKLAKVFKIINKNCFELLPNKVAIIQDNTKQKKFWAVDPKNEIRQVYFSDKDMQFYIDNESCLGNLSNLFKKIKSNESTIVGGFTITNGMTIKSFLFG